MNSPVSLIQRENGAGVNIDVPAVQSDGASCDAGSDGRMRAQMRQLTNDVFQRQRAQPIPAIEVSG